MANAHSYDDLVRTIVPLPDSSHRPSRAEVAAADKRPPGPRIRTRWPDDETPSIDAVRDALDELIGADLADLDVILEGGHAAITGSVASDDDRDRTLRAIAEVPGVIAVIDSIRVRG